MQTMDRREFIKYTSAALAWLAMPHFSIPDEPVEQPASETPPSSFGRIATWWRQAVRGEPSQDAEWVTWKRRDEIIPLYAAVAGDPPWPGNPVWYQTEGGFIHSGYVQPVEKAPSAEIITEVAAPGFWARVCVPIAEACWQPTRSYARQKLYYGTVYRVVGATADEDGNWWYQLKDGVTYAPGPYVLAQEVRRIPAEEMAPISPGCPEKWIEINIATQMLTCFEGETVVFRTRISSGAAGTATPRGEHRVLYKRHTRRMVGGSADDYYDLPGVAFPVYFTRSACAIHGTYWHNDFVRPHSHGCVNVTNQAAQWVFRWADPVVPYDEYERKATPEEGTRIVVI
ncbi:MAG: L,D-transpeptidase [Chloroflexota bacterium]|nr:L,D-transpeptidase [Chloroflexota bacterium]